MGPPGELCQGRQRPSSMAMAPLFLLHHFPAVSFALNVLCMALALWFQGFVPKIVIVPAMVAAMPTMVGVAPLGGAVFSSVAT